MKATYKRDGLLAAVQIANAAIASRDVKPILRNIKVIAEKDKSTLLATDLELGIRLEVRGVRVEEPGEAMLPAATTLDILRESKDDELVFEADADECLITGQFNRFKVPSQDPRDFPDVPGFTSDKYHEVLAGTLHTMIRRTVFAAAVEGVRYAMNGLLWEIEEHQLRLVATDGRRLAVTEGPATAHGGHTSKGQADVVPTKAMGLLERNLHDADEPVLVRFRPERAGPQAAGQGPEENAVLFKAGPAVIYSRLVEGRYPPYREVFPKKAAVKIPLVAGPFLVAVRQSEIMTSDESRRVRFSFSKSKLTLEAEAAEVGRANVELAVEHDGKPVAINFDPRFLIDMLKVLEPDASLTLELVDGNAPALFRAGDNYQYVVMPLS
jgi:DNA polymerase-3 subunit beta